MSTISSGFHLETEIEAQQILSLAIREQNLKLILV